MIGEPEFTRNLRPEDVGTRLEHMMDLQSLWSTAYGILTRSKMYHTELEKERAKQLELALALLQHHMEAEYSPTATAREINNLPKDAKDIL